MVDPQGFESVYKMRRSTFSYVYSLVRIPLFEDTMASDHTFTFVDGRVLSLQDGVAIALRVLGSGETPEMVGSSIGVSGSTVSLVTQVFIQAMRRIKYDEHFGWPHASSELEKIKHKFDKIHGLRNCCGVLHTAHIKFGSSKGLLQIIVDPDMRFTDIWWGPSGSMNQCSLLQDSWAFKICEEGVALNGLSVIGGGSQKVGEYVIGDGGYPLRPCLLTPYQLTESDSDYKKEFNRRHSTTTQGIMLRALARLKDTWKCLQGEGWHSTSNEVEMGRTICVCCLLHNIVIDMEEEEGAGIMPSDWEHNKTENVRQIAEEDAVRVRDVLAHYLMEYGDHTMATSQEEAQQVVPAASGSEAAF